MKSSSNLLFFTMLMISTISVINSSSWLMMWICLEINMMSFIPLIYNYKNMYMSQSMMMYFLIQSMSSMLFISSILMSNFLIKTPEMIQNMIIIFMVMKMGMPPMHLWFIQIMNKMSWPMCFMLMTWQKIAPMYIMSSIIYLNKMSMMMICLSTITGAIMGLNKTSTKKIMAYSSINHLGWMMACTACHKKSWMMYLMLYTLLMLIMCMFLYKFNVMYVNQMSIFSFKITEKMTFISLMLSIGGIPPFLGFLPKWMTLQYMVFSNEMIMLLIMTISSLITLTFYLRMISSINLLMSHSQKWMMMSPSISSMPLILINSMLPLMILTLNFF